MTRKKKYNKTIEFDKNDKNIEIWSSRIVELLNEQGLTQEELARKSGVSKGSITAWIFGDKQHHIRTEPKIKSLNSVAQVLGVSVDYLIGNTDIKPLNLKLQAISKETGLSEKTISLFKEIKALDNEKELSRFFENDIGKSFLLSIVEFCSDVKENAHFRGYLASTSDEPFITEIVEDLRLKEVQGYEVIAYRISQYLQRYFDERAKEIYQPVLEFEKQRNEELIQENKEFDEWLSESIKDGEDSGNNK